MTTANTDAIMNQPERVQALRRVAETVADGAAPLIDLYRPYVDGLHNLPADGRFLLVGNHTQFGAEGLLIPLLVRRAIGMRVRPLTDRNFGRMGGLPGDLLAAVGAVVGAPETARELMVHDEPILVFPGGGREIAKFKGEEYTLRWQGRTGFARLAVEYSYPIVPVGLVGGDDVYRSMTTREGRWGRLSQSLTERLSGPLRHGNAAHAWDRPHADSPAAADVPALRQPHRHSQTRARHRREMGHHRQTGRPAITGADPGRPTRDPPQRPLP